MRKIYYKSVFVCFAFNVICINQFHGGTPGQVSNIIFSGLLYYYHEYRSLVGGVWCLYDKVESITCESIFIYIKYIYFDWLLHKHTAAVLLKFTICQRFILRLKTLRFIIFLAITKVIKSSKPIDCVKLLRYNSYFQYPLYEWNGITHMLYFSFYELFVWMAYLQYLLFIIYLVSGIHLDCAVHIATLISNIGCHRG